MTTSLTLSVTQVAELLGCDRDTLYDSLKAGTCTMRHLRAGRRVVFPIGTLCADLGITPGMLAALDLIPPAVAALFPLASSPTPLRIADSPTKEIA